MILFHQGRDAEAQSLFLRALAAEPGWAKPRFNLGLVRLMLGDYDLGFLLHEARRGVPGLTRTPPLPFPEWRGEPLAGRRIVVIGEQGFGDQIMFARFLPELRRRGAEVRYFCGAETAPLFEGASAVLDDGAAADFWVLAGSLPLRLGARADRLPPPISLPVAMGSGGGIGVAAQGRPEHGNDAHRSLSGEAADRLRAWGHDLSPAATGAKDFLETARIIAGLDLVISVDTSIAHLAASLGKPTWILLPNFGLDWRWMRGRTDSPWYPSARLFRQGEDSWDATLSEIESLLPPR